jgi:hypothetical protein
VFKTVIALNLKDGSDACAAWMFEIEWDQLTGSPEVDAAFNGISCPRGMR